VEGQTRSVDHPSGIARPDHHANWCLILASSFGQTAQRHCAGADRNWNAFFQQRLLDVAIARSMKVAG